MMQNQIPNNYLIMFSLNGNDVGSMCVNEKMMFCEVSTNFMQFAQLKPENEATFSFNSKTIKSDSGKTLKELEIKENAKIEVTAKNIPNNNVQNSQTNNNFPIMGNPMNSNMGGMVQGMGVMYPSMAQGMGVMYPSMAQGMGVMYPSMGGMTQGMGGMAQGMGGMAQGMGGMAQGMGGNATNTTGTSTNSSGTAGKTDNIGDDINWNIIFQGNGKIINVQATKDLKFSELATRFKNKSATEDVPTFFINSFKYEDNDQRTLSQIGLHNQSKIDVVFTNSVIGAYY